MVKNLSAIAGDAGLIPGSGRSPGVGNDSPLQYSCLGNPMDRSLAGYSPWGCKRGRHHLSTKQQQNDLGKLLPLSVPHLCLICK